MDKHYACSDLHGMYDLWIQIKKFLDESDRLYFLGDAADRGVSGIPIMQDLLTDSRVTYLLGNHEDIMIQEIPCLMEGRCFASLWAYNGGEPTMNDFSKLPEGTQKWILRELKQLPREAYYCNKSNQIIHMTHAGTTPPMDETSWRMYGIRDAYIWSRDHFYDPWPEGYDDRFEIHGHTPVPFLTRELTGEVPKTCDIVKYADGHKIDIDLGCFASNRIALLDLDTLEPIYFKSTEDVKS